MEIPPRLLRPLEQDRSLHAAVLRAFADFEPILKHSHLPFFPDYTDHGPDHIQGVLRTAAAIIRDEADPVLTPGDAAVLTLAILLHDIALHLSEDGFLRLIGPKEPQPSPLFPDDRPWPRLWEEYLGIARRFDARQLREIFGDTDPVSRPGLDPNHWTKRDRFLIGDFLRRHHHRLAHEIALRGFPGPPGQSPLRLDSPEEIADLAGIVARSHGMALRSTFPYLEKNYDLRQYQGVHAVFLMVVLRIADYLQIEADRAPKQLLRLRRLRSPFSLGKWKEHHAIRDIRTTEPDPEAIFVHALPEDVVQYLALKDLLQGLQKELDLSWAVLGEVYGRWDELKALGLTSRRVLSNLDDEEKFAQSVKYIPRRAAFEVTSGAVIPLLVKPLYGDRPDIGVREILQNAVDAVRELREYRKAARPPGPKSDPEVRVSLESGPGGQIWLAVADQGIGMTADVVAGYFLKVGASFRRSDAWRKAFEDEDGRSRVLRSGHFGVGALAAFLLGDEIEVSTRHVDSSAGISFSATLSTEAIELRKCHRDVGTTVRVRLREDGIKAAKNTSWYRLSDPTIAWFEYRGPIISYLPGPLEALPFYWRRLFHSEYQDVQWTYENAPGLTCNGIFVREQRFENLWNSAWGASILCPNVSVFDPDGRLPLNLVRTNIIGGRLPFEADLLEDVIRDLVAYSLLKAPRTFREFVNLNTAKDYYKGLLYPTDLSSPWFSTSTGTGLLTPWILKKERIEALVVIPLSREWGSTPGKTCFELGLPIVWHSWSPGYTETWIRHLFDLDQDKGIAGWRLVIRKEWALQLTDYQNSPFRWLGYWTSKNIQVEGELFGWCLLSYGNCPVSAINFNSFKESEKDAYEDILMAEIYLAHPEQALVPSKVDEIWYSLLGQATIPYSMEERRRVLAPAFRELEPYLKAHELRGRA